MTAHEVALRIAALYGWAPTTDPMEMGTIREKVNWDVLSMVEAQVVRYGISLATAATAACCAAVCECCADGIEPVQDPRGRWTHRVAGARVPCRADAVWRTDAETVPRTAHPDYACCCGGEGRCGYCHEEAISREEFRGEREERP